MKQAVQGRHQGLHPRPALQPGRPARQRRQDLRPVHRRRPDRHHPAARRPGDVLRRQDATAATPPSRWSAWSTAAAPAPARSSRPACRTIGRAIIIGARSYGKGSVQTIHPFDTGGQLKLTTATFWRPSGRNLNSASTGGKDEDEWGVTPNIGFDIKLGNKELNDLQEYMHEQDEIIHGPGPPVRDEDERLPRPPARNGPRVPACPAQDGLAERRRSG